MGKIYKLEKLLYDKLKLNGTSSIFGVFESKELKQLRRKKDILVYLKNYKIY